MTNIIIIIIMRLYLLSTKVPEQGKYMGWHELFPPGYLKFPASRCIRVLHFLPYLGAMF